MKQRLSFMVCHLKSDERGVRMEGIRNS